VPQLVYICGIDPGVFSNGHVSYVKAHALAASRAGFSPQLFCVGPASGTELTSFGTVHRVATPVHHYLLAPVWTKPIARAVADELERHEHQQPILVHSFGPWARTAVDVSAELSRRGIEAVPIASAYTTITHEWRAHLDAVGGPRALSQAARLRAWFLWVRTVLSRNECLGYERASMVLVNYDSVARLVREGCERAPEIRRMPYAAPSAFCPTAATSDRLPDTIKALGPTEAPLIVSASRHVARKGVGVLIRALAGLDEMGVSYRACVLSGGRLLAPHRRLAAELGLDGQVALPGHVEDVAPYLRAADVFVLPSLEEGSGSVSLLEALQAGAAVVASRCDGIGEDLVDGETALLVPPGDERALRNAIADLLANPDLRSTLGANARRLYHERFSADSFTDALKALYAEVSALQ
jgi:glycosyltransferase involved in cell wall biosynthesis